jgi:putative sterol carrier protein
MTDANAEFFQGLAARGHEPRLRKVTATLRFDVSNGQRASHWFVTIEKGDIAVSRKNAKADCVVRGNQAVLAGIARGEVHPFSALLRGELAVEGDAQVLVQFQRLFAGRPRSAA